MRKLTNRLDKLTAKAEMARPQSPLEGMTAAWKRDRQVFLAHVPPDLCEAVAARLACDTDEAFAEWRLRPFARWAPPMAPDFVFPRALVEWMLNPPHSFWMGHTCEGCGLHVPLFTACLTDSPKDLRPFPTCPSCGGNTSHAAHYQPGPKTEGSVPDEPR